MKTFFFSFLFYLLLTTNNFLFAQTTNVWLELVKVDSVHNRWNIPRSTKALYSPNGEMVGYEEKVWNNERNKTLDSLTICLNNGLKFKTEIMGFTFVSDDLKTIVKFGTKISSEKNKKNWYGPGKTRDTFHLVFFDANGKEVKHIDKHCGTYLISMSSDGHIVLYSTFQDNSYPIFFFTLYNFRGEELWRKVSPKKYPTSLSISDNAEYIALMGIDSGRVTDSTRLSLYLLHKNGNYQLIKDSLPWGSESLFCNDGKNMMLFTAKNKFFINSEDGKILWKIENDYSAITTFPIYVFEKLNLILLFSDKEICSTKSKWYFILFDLKNGKEVMNYVLPTRTQSVFITSEKRLHKIDENSFFVKTQFETLYYQLKRK